MLFIAKDLPLYPLMGAVFRPASDRRLVGASGEAVETLAPTGYVAIQGERWRARLLTTGSLPTGAAVRVVDARGLMLLVEPAQEGESEASPAVK